MLIAKISFYFESAKKTGEKFREKLEFQNHCPHPYHPPNRYQDTMKGLYATFSSWHIDPCRFTVKCGGDMFAGHLILLPSFGVYLMLLISKLLLKFNPTCYRLECHSKERYAFMVFTHLIGFFSWSPTITTIN